MTEQTYENLKASVELHRLTLENIMDPVFVTDDDGKFTFVCPNISHILGYSVDEIESMGNISVLLGGSIFDMEQLEKQNIIKNIETEIIDKKGDKHVYDVIVKKVSIQSGTVLYACREITERKEAIDTLKKKEKQYRTVVQTAMDGLFLVNANGCLVDVNSAYCKMSGYSKQELLSMRVADLEALETAEEVDGHIKRGIAHGKERFETKHRRKDGSIFDVEVSFQYESEIGLFFSFCRDITPKKLIDREKQITERRLKALWEITRMADAPIQDIYDKILGLAKDMSLSKYAFYGLLSEDEKTMNIYSWSKEALADCKIHESPLKFSIAKAGIWGDAIRHRKTIVVNDYQNTQLRKKGLPGGHVDISNLLVVPVFESGRIVAVGAVANKPSDYDQNDVEQMEIFLANAQILINRKEFEAQLKDKEALLEKTEAFSKTGGWELDVDSGKLTWTNEVYRIYGVDRGDYDVSDVDVTTAMSFYAPDSIPTLKKAFLSALTKGESYDLELEFIRADGERIWVRTIGKPELRDGKVKRIAGNFMDITERKRTQIEMEEQRNRLEEMNTALKILIEHREKEKKKFEKNVYENVKKLVLPYLDKLNRVLQKPENKTYLEIAKSNLQDLVSPFAEGLSLASLTPVEFEVADMIKHGKTSKEIASLMNLSSETVRFHRKRIRNKLGIKKKQINLRTYLNSIPEPRG